MPAKKSTAPSISPALYAKLVKLGTARGKVSSISAVLGTEETAVIRRYLDHMKTADATLWKGWGSQWKPEEPEGDTDADDIFGDSPLISPDNIVEEDLFGIKEDEEGCVIIQPAAHTTPVTPPPAAAGIPEKFRLRKSDGTDVNLEVFSKSPKFGYILRVPVPTDMRTVTVAGREVTLDLLALQNDPDGVTTVWDGKIVANSKLINLIKAQEDL